MKSTRFILDHGFLLRIILIQKARTTKVRAYNTLNFTFFKI